jgi:hypothetical protein
MLVYVFSHVAVGIITILPAIINLNLYKSCSLAKYWQKKQGQTGWQLISSVVV